MVIPCCQLQTFQILLNKYLDLIDSNLSFNPKNDLVNPLKKKTTLKWTSDGEFSAVDKPANFLSAVGKGIDRI